MKVSIETITPARAAELLDNNTQNRIISPRAISRYARAMKSGRWDLNGESIQIAADGRLLNGQHRLLACIEAGVPFQTVLVTGLTSDVQDTMDTGRSRGPAGQLQIDGVPNANATAAVVRQIYHYLTGETDVDTRQTKEFLAQHGDVRDCIAAAMQAKKIVPSSVLGAVLWLGSRNKIYWPKINAFCEPLATGEGLAAGDPRLSLRNALINARIVNKGHAPRQDYVMSLTVHAWNGFVSGRKLSHVKAYMTRGKRYEMPSVVGGPKPGSGIDEAITL